ncbi:MAG: aldehyde dehydrogenase family protein, partial [Rhodospirillales bacterium]|nr:aldehyde dehydrogenase family protein [Rhodospirillales bacterium]
MAESAATLEYQRDFSLTIDGQRVAGDEIMEVIDPATEEVFAIAPAAGRGHLEQAVASARQASGDWRARSFEERAELIRQYSVLLRERKHELGTLLTREQGK